MFLRNKIPQSWGHYPQIAPNRVIPIFWRDEVPDLAAEELPVLPYGYGRSYGDSCLNEGGILLDMRYLNKFIAFDGKKGILRCEAGVALADILELVMPHGWFLPVTPGTKFVSVGGAIANDVHGKNHHRAGTFGCHVTCFELLRSDGQRLHCSPEENEDLFRATIGGLGLTGVILWAEIRLRSISSPLIEMERIRFSSLREFIDKANASEQDFEHTVAWVDCWAQGQQLGRGFLMRGNHASIDLPLDRGNLAHARHPLTIPFDFPSWILNTATLKAFNIINYHLQYNKCVQKIVSYDSFFYPLDAIHQWNRMYGKKGFLQYQCIVPYQDGYEAMKELLQKISHSGQGSFLAVLKTFGHRISPGMLSFPRPGLELALDFANRGEKTLKLLEELDMIVRPSGGAVYPAKDARMSAKSFQTYFPQWREFAQHVDPKFSSSFWRRVTEL